MSTAQVLFAVASSFEIFHSPPAAEAQRQAREERLVQVGSADANVHPLDVGLAQYRERSVRVVRSIGCSCSTLRHFCF